MLYSCIIHIHCYFYSQEYDEIKTYPIEVIPGFLYLGTLAQGNAAYIQKDLKVRGHVNCSEEAETLLVPNIYHIKFVLLVFFWYLHSSEF